MGFMGIFALIVLTCLVATTIGVVVWLAMLPGKIAAQRQHPQTRRRSRMPRAGSFRERALRRFLF